MLVNGKTLQGYALHCLDGEIGKIKEFYFDDRHWTSRYLVVDTGNWLSERQILISPYALTDLHKEGEFIKINLTKKQIMDSPSIDVHKPVSRQFEESYYLYYGWPVYWEGPYTWGPFPNPVCDRELWDSATKRKKTWDAHLRSTHEVASYGIQTTDGELGHVDDFVFDEDTWVIRYLIVSTGKWWSGKKVLIAPSWIKRVSWSEAKVFVNLTRETIKESPEFTEDLLVSRDYESRLHRYFDQPGYWVDDAVTKEVIL